VERSALRIAIIGAGMGGLAAAAILRRHGHSVTVYEQASRFARVGAGIQQSANALRVLRSLGLEDAMRRVAFRPLSWTNREWDSGELKHELLLGDAFEDRYGAPYLLLHRGDLHQILASVVPESSIRLNHRLVGLEQGPSGVTLRFDTGQAGGLAVEADLVVGADGVHSTVRERVFGAEDARYTGRVAYRTTFPAALMGGLSIEDCTKWWGPDRHIVMYYVTAARDEVYFVTSQPEPDWREESWSARGDIGELREAFSGFHPTVRAVLAACPEVHKWALRERDPLPTWHQGAITLLGDACHPMMPYMAQGAANALEDAAVLARCLEGVGRDGVEQALGRYERTRLPRTSQVQLTSRRNEWMSTRTDPDWVYGYDALSVPLAD
jgi:salicylate hydroxylase/6-hydroxynicotinate 3-monooxygenase